MGEFFRPARNWATTCARVESRQAQGVRPADSSLITHAIDFEPRPSMRRDSVVPRTAEASNFGHLGRRPAPKMESHCRQSFSGDLAAIRVSGRSPKSLRRQRVLANACCIARCKGRPSRNDAPKRVLAPPNAFSGQCDQNSRRFDRSDRRRRSLQPLVGEVQVHLPVGRRDIACSPGRIQ